ncbi:interferon-induced very large GTPase 1-like [Bombina bombina]|uniref:interferon-induced very large GTPase 1-like n=1 Tax=Bombina bombina TaxID=8345 RepID=UPI00235A5260|nr:interferon-induced very large GTPase 1-like [Bombina bombina]
MDSNESTLQAITSLQTAGEASQTDEDSQTPISLEETDGYADSTVTDQQIDRDTQVTVTDQQMDRDTQEAGTDQQIDRDTQVTVTDQKIDRDTQGAVTDQQIDRDTQVTVTDQQIDRDTQEAGTDQQMDRDTQGAVTNQQIDRDTQGAVTDQQIDRDTQGAGTVQQIYRDTQGAGTVQQIYRDTQVTVTDQQIDADTQGAGTDQQIDADTQGAGTDQQIDADTQGAGTDQQIDADTQGAGTDQQIDADTQGAGTDQQIDADTQGAGTDQQIDRDTQGAGTDQQIDRDTQGAGTDQQIDADTQGAGTDQQIDADTQGAGTDQQIDADTQGAGTDQQIDREAYTILTQMRSELIQIFQEDVDSLFDELDALFSLSLEDFMLLNQVVVSPEERTEMLLNLILQKGEPACQTFLQHLENMILQFPLLSSLSHKNKMMLNELMTQFKMKDYKTSKLTLKDILDIGQENVKDGDPQTVEEIPWYCLRKLMALNSNARNTQVKQDFTTRFDNTKQNMCDDFNSVFFEEDTSGSFHPLDVLCVLLHCSDAFLQQEIINKMSMCQFAVPLLLPAGDGKHCTLMLWAMREIVKRWRPHSLAESKGFREDSLVHIPMPTFSFVKLGESKLSKSKTLNSILSQAGQYHDFFIHNNMECGNIRQKVSDGTVEITWYFPAGRGNSDNFPEPIAVTNLRGDLRSNWTQFSLLTQVSSAVFIFVEDLSKEEFQLLSQCSNSDTQFYFIISPSNGKCVNKETLEVLKELFPLLKIDARNVMRKDKIGNKAQLTNAIHLIITSVLKTSSKRVKLEDMSDTAHNLGILVDQSNNECHNAEVCAREIAEEITDVTQYKMQTMKLQGDLWKQLSQTEKEMCRMRKQGDKNVEDYRSELIQRHLELHKKQHEHDLSDSMVKFVSAITNLSQVEKYYFLKLVKFKLDTIARKKMTLLKAEYKDKCNDILNNQLELTKLDEEITNSSLGVEHFLRELGQFYEAEFSMVQEKQISAEQRQFTKLPGIAADLLMDGFPLELIDGDASNIPLQWVTDVLTELDNKTGGGCRLRVITVLGVQSTGKSTLLNTMFGLQFPVSTGRCTRGAFMTLIKVKENCKEELGCDFILVIDTEGLKAPELASLEDSYEHDNELATLVIGLSDITIINMAMENTAEMKDILQIVVHAFLRMKEIGKKPNCQFVHQNVSDVSAHENNMRDRKKLLEQLNKMTKVAANMEKNSSISKFSDVMDYDFEKNNWYIPGLWQGVPPMAPVNSGYGENVYELKKYLFKLIKKHQCATQNIQSFIEWTKSLWKAVKYEKFIFNFRNSLVADAYNQLSIKYTQWEWEFSKKVHHWLIRTETIIRNQSADKLKVQSCKSFKEELYIVLDEEGKKMSDLVEKYFENGSENVHLIEKYREDFFRSVTVLRKELERNTLDKLSETLRIQKAKNEIQSIQDKAQQVIEKKVTDLLVEYRAKKCELNELEIEKEFEIMWQKALSDLQIPALEQRNITDVILHQLRNDMSNKGAAINERLLSTHFLHEFKMDNKYIDTKWSKWNRNRLYISREYSDKIQDLADSLIDTCIKYVDEKVNTNEDYSDTYSQELLHIINKRLEKDVKSLHMSSLFELDIKVFIFGKAAPKFEKMHNDYIQHNDPMISLAELKPLYFSVFKDIFQEKDDCQERARKFCEMCLKPAIKEYIYRHLGGKMVDDSICNQGRTFSSRTFFQCTLLEQLLNEDDFDQYVVYINRYEKYTRNWIVKYIIHKYKNYTSIEPLLKDIMSSLKKEIEIAFTSAEAQKTSNVFEFLKYFCEMLKDKLVISQNQINVTLFNMIADVQQFSKDIKDFLTETEQQIISETKSLDIESLIFKLKLKPQDELFKRVVGCGKQCPFCKVPCEAGAGDHTEHFASVHRPQGLGSYIWEQSEKLVSSICSTEIVSDDLFTNTDTHWKYHPYKEYKQIYPDWAIQPDPSIKSSDYWKFIFAQFNKQFATEYKAKPADLPEDWKRINKEDALKSLKETFKVQ